MESRLDSARQPEVEREPSALAITLPKGGGAIRGIGEKFSANPVTGAGAMTVPIATSPGRAGFGPELSLAYDSGAGNGCFGFGWRLSLPAVTRKTDTRLPQYHDGADSDLFVLAGAEDLTPIFTKDDQGQWALQNGRPVLYDETRIVHGVRYRIRRYRPRREGLFARIERWTQAADPANVHWRSISGQNVLTVYGKDATSRISDPENPEHIFSWLICERRDDRGNAVLYDYRAEDGAGIDLGQAHEHHRGDAGALQRSANRYLKRIQYGNRLTLLDDHGQRPVWLSTAQIERADWMFEVVLDYGEHDIASPSPQDGGHWIHQDDDLGKAVARWIANDEGHPWLLRYDPFSSYRAGFEVRTTRLCRRVCMFHHFDSEPGVGLNCLVRSTDFRYSSQQDVAAARTPTPIYSFLHAVSQSSYLRAGAGYRKRSLPPLEFEYSRPIVQESEETIDAESLENLPIGLDNSTYQWIDLHGEGAPGILSEQGGAWFYKRNLSPLGHKSDPDMGAGAVNFAPIEQVAIRPNHAQRTGARFLDLTGAGQSDLTQLNGVAPGLFAHDGAESWRPFRPFPARLNRDFNDPNLRFIDLDGDGQPDLLISEENAFVWHAGLARDGFGPPHRLAHALNDEQGPCLLFADDAQSIYLADCSGDGLTDIVRIDNGEICYWPNLGYARFGAKVSMDNAPAFDHPDHFDQKRLRLADIDGSGTTDILYLHREGVHIYFNQSGNSWSEAVKLRVFPPVDNVATVMLADLLGNGVACLVWSSPLAGNAPQQMRYVNLVGAQKPHLLVKSVNNLGAETRIEYAPSTLFYLQDRLAGKPWITRLPFPIHVVAKVVTSDKWRGTSFTTSYSYHHGYFDQVERDFGGFGRVEQIDCESYSAFAGANGDSPYIAADKTLYQPPVKTISWYHTGRQQQAVPPFAEEQFPSWLQDSSAGQGGLSPDFEEVAPSQTMLAGDQWDADEWREAAWACRGLALRQEIIALDADALERGEQRPLTLFSTSQHRCEVQRLQPKASNANAVFIVNESEVIVHQYELELDIQEQAPVEPDPRVSHTLNLRIDPLGNVLQSITAVYPRRREFDADLLTADAAGERTRIHALQSKGHITYTETRYTADYDPDDPDNVRLRLPCETLTYELTGIVAGADGGGASTQKHAFAPDDFRRLKLSPVYQTTGLDITDLAYHQAATGDAPAKRLVEQTRWLFFRDHHTDPEALRTPLGFGHIGRLALPYATYRLALTEELLQAVLQDKLTTSVHDWLADSSASGYASPLTMAALFPAADSAGQYWIPTGLTGFADDAAQHFFLPTRHTDPFGHSITVEYDGRDDLYVKKSVDALGNTTDIVRYDYRVLAPLEVSDINDNLSEIYFDILGLPVALALKGKGDEGDNLDGFSDALANPQPADIADFFDSADLDDVQARSWLANASVRHLYHYGETQSADGSTIWSSHPACACEIVRERHVSQLGPLEQSPLQATFEYSDGMGSVIVKKVQAEPESAGAPRRWVARGKVILNNKGMAVKRYEPYFSAPDVGHRYEEPHAAGVASTLYYDAMGRTTRIELPDGGVNRLEFSPWHIRTFDANDTLGEAANGWLARMTAPTATTEQQRAARLALEHAGTPAITVLDALGREAITITHNRSRKPDGELEDEMVLTAIHFDGEGKPLWVRDGLGRLAVQYIVPPAPDALNADPLAGYAPGYDLAGNLLFQHSMDAGGRWSLNDAAGSPNLAWDDRGQSFRTTYDPLRRPLASYVTGADPLDSDREQLVHKQIYGDTPDNGLEDPKALNLRGEPFMQFDGAGIVASIGRRPNSDQEEAFDFKGNLLRSSRRLVVDYRQPPDWSQNPALGPESYISSTRFDALNRPIQIVAPHSNQSESGFNVTQTGYNEAGLPNRIDVWLAQATEPAGLLDPASASLHAVRNIDYNAKGQRIRVESNAADQPMVTESSYDEATFRLSRQITTRPLHSDPGQRRLQDVTYTYDPVGNVTHIQDQSQPRVFFDNDCIDASNHYRYDALYRLIAASGREHRGQDLQPAWDDRAVMGSPIPYSCTELRHYVESYRYDATGNILQMSHHQGGDLDFPGQLIWRRQYQYGVDNNRLRSTSLPGEATLPFYSAAPAQYAQRYSNDKHGNMTTMPHVQQLNWDYKDQLSSVDLGGGGVAYYVYDAAGQRVRKVWEKAPGTIEERIYLNGFELYRRRNGADTVTLARETLHISDGERRVAQAETRTQGDDPAPQQLVRFQFGNHLDSVSLELDQQARVISYEEFLPYGNTAYQALRSQTETPKRYRFTGKERDEETGLAYHGARYYAPWLARWVSCDPSGLVDGVNLYEYAIGNPISLQDPSGTQVTEQIDEHFNYTEKGPGYTARRSPEDGYASPTYTFDEVDLTAPLPKSKPAPKAPVQKPAQAIAPPAPQEKPVPEKPVETPLPVEPDKPFDPYADGVPIDKSWRQEGSSYLWKGTQEAFKAAADPNFSATERYVMLQAASIGLAGSALEQLVLNPLLNAPADAFESGQLAARSVHRLSRGEYLNAYKDAKQAKDQFEGATLAVASVVLPMAKGAGVAKTAAAGEEAANALTKAEKALLRSEARELIKATGRKIMPWQDVHHRVPLQYSHLFPAAEGAESFRGLVNPNRLENLRVLNRPTHVISHIWWNHFKANYAVNAGSVTWAEQQIAAAMRWRAM